MKINAINNGTIDATLTKDELILLRNILYIHEQHTTEKLNDMFHELTVQLITARDLCQYGHLDKDSLDVIIRHRQAMSNPNMENTTSGLTDEEKQTLCHYLETNDIRTACGNTDFTAILHKILGSFKPDGKIYEYMYGD